MAALLALASAQAAPPPPVTMRFFYVSAKDPGTGAADPRLEFTLRGGREPLPFSLGANSLSAPLSYRGAPPVSLYRDRETEQGVKPEVIGRLDFPAEWKGVFFLVLPAAAPAALPFRFIPMEYWAPSIAEHHARVVNLCPVPVAARLAGRDVRVPADGRVEIDIADAVSELPVKLALQRNKGWQMVLSTALRVPAGGRMLFVLFPDDPEFHTARVLTFDDLPMPAEASAAALP